MYCHNCGYDLKKSKINKIEKKYLKEGKISEENKANMYVCPRCGAFIHKHLEENEIKHLSQAAHSEVHRAHNFNNRGKCFLVISLILIAIGMLFFVLSFKTANHGELDINCIEFYVFLALASLGAICLVYGSVNLTIGINKNNKYKQVVKAIQNQVFIQ